MRKYLMGLMAMFFLLGSLTLLAQPRSQDQGGMGQAPAQSDTAKAPKKKAKKEKKATTKKAKKAKKADKKADEMQH